METKKQQNTINTLYIMLVISTIMSFVPLMAAQILSLALILVVLCGAYYYRGKGPEDGLLANHMIYMIGTIWIGTTFLLVGMIAAGLWVYSAADHSIIEQAVMNIQNGVMMDEAALTALMMDYMAANKTLLIQSSMVTIGPAILYFVYRVANGFSRSIKGYRIANPKSWM